jgi:hypothetical protein
LQNLKITLKNSKVEERQLFDELNVLDGFEEERLLCDEEKLRKDKVIGDLERVRLLEEMSWRQKPSKLWLGVGGTNVQSFSREWLTQIGEITPFSRRW